MKKMFALFLLCTGLTWAAPIDGFPADPPGTTVRDRLYEVVTVGKQEHTLYAAVCQPVKKAPARVLIYSGKASEAGVEWKLLHTWVLQEGGMSFDVSRSVLKVSAHGDEEIQFWFQEWFKYVEGRASLVLHYYPKTRKFEFQLSD